MSAPRRDLLAAHALGLLGPAERADLERALAADPALAAEHAEVVAHLALYQRFPAPAEPPPFARIAASLAPPRRRRLAWVGAAAAAVLVGLLAREAVRALWRAGKEGDRPSPVRFVAGEGLTTAKGWAGPVLAAALQPAEVRLGERARVVLDARTSVELVREDLVRLVGGRAHFEVERGSEPFQVATPHGVVEVLGTRFEVDVRGGLVVTVSEGRVRAAGRDVGAGERLAGGAVAPTPEPAGAFFRRPLVRLEGPGSARPGERIQVRLVLENPTNLRQEVRGPETVASGALLTLTGPGGQDETRSLDFARALSGGLAAAGTVVLEPRERRLTVFEVDVPSAPSGSWRLAALYRPQGEAPIASAPFLLEVR